MSFLFNCPTCGARITGTVFLEGRRIRCPECECLVTPSGAELGTVNLEPSQDDADRTVILEAAEVAEAVAFEGPLEVTDAVDAMDVLPVAEQELPAPKQPAMEVRRKPKRPPPRPEPQRIERPRRRVSDAVVDMTPMVDVTFLLLIFFMVTATFTMQKSLAIPKDAEDDPSTTVIEVDPLAQSDFVTVLVDEFNTFQVVTVDWEREAPSEQDLHAILREARGGDSTGTVPTKLRVEAHGDSLHQRVVAAIDAGTANGFEEVLLASVFDE